MQGAASCQALLAGGELGIGRCHKSSRARQSFHLSFKMEPKAFLPRLSEEFSPVLTATYLFHLPPLPSWLPAEAKAQAWGGQPIPATLQTHIGAPKKVQKSPCVFEVCWLEWAPNAPNTHPSGWGVPAESQEYLVPLIGEVWCSPDVLRCTSGI